ncbi:MAG: hypothetical protein RI907_3301 [Pseudomonadota bacterium]
MTKQRDLTMTLSKMDVAHCSGLVGLAMAGCLAFGGAMAQGLPTTLQAGPVLTMPSGMKAEPLALNPKGEVGGWGAKSAGSVLRLGSNDGSPVPSYGFYWEPMSYIYPVVWTNGTPTTLTRYRSNNNTAIFSAGPAGGWYAMSTGGSAKESTSAWLDDNLSYLSRTAKVHLGLVNGAYTPLGRAVWMPDQPPLVNQRGTVAGVSGDMPADVQIEVGGRVVLPTKPAGLAKWVVVGLSDDDRVLIKGHMADVYTETAQGTVLTQAYWQERCYVWHNDVLTEVTAPSPQPVVTVNCGGISPNGLVAAYVGHNNGGPLDASKLSRAMFTWRDGHFERLQSPFTVQQTATAPKVRLTDTGMGYYMPDPLNAGTLNTDLWVFAQGQHQRVAPLVRPALASTSLVRIRAMNAAGQVLAEVRTSASAAPKFQVLTPR